MNEASSGYRHIGEGSVVLSREQWQAVMDALEGDHSCRDDAFDALQRWAPAPWLEGLDERYAPPAWPR